MMGIIFEYMKRDRLVQRLLEDREGRKTSEMLGKLEREKVFLFSCELLIPLSVLSYVGGAGSFQ